MIERRKGKSLEIGFCQWRRWQSIDWNEEEKIQMRKILFDDFFSSETHGKTDYMIESLMEKIIREALTGMPKELQLLFALPNDEEQ